MEFANNITRSFARSLCATTSFFFLRPLFRFKTASVLIAHQMTHTFILDKILNYTQLKITIIHKWTTRYLSPIHVSCVMWYLIWLCKKQKKLMMICNLCTVCIHLHRCEHIFLNIEVAWCHSQWDNKWNRTATGNWQHFDEMILYVLAPTNNSIE